MSHALFQISIKIILVKGNKILALKTNDNYLDFPGGRLDHTEVNLDHRTVAQREIEEELGANLKVNIGKLAFVSRRSYTKDGVENNVIAIFYQADYLSGEIQLSDEHVHAGWIDPNDIFVQGVKFMSVDEEKQLRDYFTA
jgi:8-oxo-dGTP pyrophosphatase MutT (NUDIX family)